MEANDFVSFENKIKRRSPMITNKQNCWLFFQIYNIWLNILIFLSLALWLMADLLVMSSES